MIASSASRFALLCAMTHLAISLFGCGVAKAQQEAFLYPTPVTKQRIQGGVLLLLNKDTTILYDERSTSNAKLLQQEIKLSLGMTLKIDKYGKTVNKPQNSIILKVIEENALFGDIKQALMHSEGYELSVKNDYVLIVGGDIGGQFYGVMALLQLIHPETRIIPKVQIIDFPKMSFRGLRGHLPRKNPDEIEQFKRIIRAMAFCRLNQLWIRDLYVRRFPASLRFDSHPEICDNDALSKSIARELIDYAKRYNVKVMGSLAATADNVWSVYPHLIEMGPRENPFTVKIKKEKGRTPKYRFGSRFNFCPSREETYRLLFDFIDEMVPLFTSEVFDLGIDEVGQEYNGSRWVACELCKDMDPAKLFAEYVNRLADYVVAKGKNPLVNSTPFIRDHGGTFHNIYKAVSLIRKDIIINNWSDGHVRASRKVWFRRRSNFKSTDYFAKFGFDKIVHLVGHQRRWRDRPELLDTKGLLDCYGAFITHYSYMTDGNFINGESIDDMAFSSNHFWTPNLPEMGSKQEQIQIAYSRRVIQNILEGKTIIQAASDGRAMTKGSY